MSAAVHAHVLHGPVHWRGRAMSAETGMPWPAVLDRLGVFHARAGMHGPITASMSAQLAAALELTATRSADGDGPAMGPRPRAASLVYAFSWRPCALTGNPSPQRQRTAWTALARSTSAGLPSPAEVVLVQHRTRHLESKMEDVERWDLPENGVSPAV